MTVTGQLARWPRAVSLVAAMIAQIECIKTNHYGAVLGIAAPRNGISTAKTRAKPS